MVVIKVVADIKAVVVVVSIINGVCYGLRLIALLLLIIPLQLFASDQTNKTEAPLFNNLGSFHFPISTTVPLAQRFFDQGLILYYSFEWGESIRSFRESTRLDPHCGMCFWGLALALGDKNNAPMNGHEYQDAKSAIEQALLLKQYETKVEQDYIQALANRFQHTAKKLATKTFSCHPFNPESDKSSNQELLAYENAMKKMIASYPNDNNAKALYVYALFDSLDWKFWDASFKINPRTPQMIDLLQSILSKEPLHIGANHYYVHVLEQSPEPIKANDSAKRLETLVPGSEHMVHMPTHIYFLTGRFHDATNSNLNAIAAYQQYNHTCEQQGFAPEINYLYLHNYDFLRTTAAMEGNKTMALKATQELLKPPFAAWLAKEPSLQWFIAVSYFVKARFGMWQEILNEKAPSPQYQYALGMWHYVRGLADVKNNKIKDAEDESHKLAALIQKGPSSSNLGRGGVNLLMIAANILNATIADARDDENATIAYLNGALKIQHDMGYHEPPDWYFPVKEALADAYLKWNHPKEALELYQQDLQQYPKNGWALFGLAKSLKANGQEKAAQDIESEYKQAWRHADIAAPIGFFRQH